MQKFHQFHLSTGEEKGIAIEQEYFKFSHEECTRSLFGRKIHGERKGSYQGLKNTMTGLWRINGELKVREIGYNLFQFICPTNADSKRILLGHTWTFDGQFLVLKKWEENLLERRDIFLLYQRLGTSVGCSPSLVFSGGGKEDWENVCSYP